LASDVRMNPPLCVPTKTRTPLMVSILSGFCDKVPIHPAYLIGDDTFHTDFAYRIILIVNIVSVKHLF
jgi:hypothetical protein